MDAYLKDKKLSRFSVRPKPYAPGACKKDQPDKEQEKTSKQASTYQRYYTYAAEKTGMSVSDNGVALIKKFEGFVPNLYNDPVGHCTIGYGTLVHKGNCNGSEPEEFKSGVSEQRATELLTEEVNKFAVVINSNVQVALNQNQFDALISFVYNVGEGAFKGSTLLKELNKGNYTNVPTELRKWVKASGQTLPGLVRRREEEAGLFVTPVSATAQSLSQRRPLSSPYSKEKDDRPRGIRNNNPGNIVLTQNNDWEGRVAPDKNTDGHFEQFTTYAYGVRALIILLRNYIRLGRKTISKIFEAYAPPTENNTQNYIRFVAGRLAVSAEDPLSVTKNTLKERAQAIAKMENGQECITDDQFEEGYALVPEAIRSSITQSIQYNQYSRSKGYGYSFTMSANNRVLVILVENGGIDLGIPDLVNKVISRVPGSSLIPQDAIDRFSNYANDKIKELTDKLLESAELAANRYSSAQPEFYNEVVILRDGTASYTDLKNTLLRLTKEDKIIDLFILTHGRKDYISVTGGIDSSKIRQIRADNGNNPIRLRAVYMMNCVGSSLNQAWLDIGAKVSSGAAVNNYLPEPSMFFFWSNWKSGQSFNDAVTNAYVQTIAAIKSLIQSAGDIIPGGGTIANAIADIENTDFVKDSRPVIQGDGTLMITSDTLSFTQSMRPSAFAVTVLPTSAVV